MLNERATAGEAVDFIVEAGSRLIPIDVKNATGHPEDARHLATFRRKHKRVQTALPHAGDRAEWLAPGHSDPPVVADLLTGRGLLFRFGGGFLRA